MAKTKEQIQMIILAAIMGGGALVAGVHFGLAPRLLSYKQSRAGIAELERMLDEGKAFTQKGAEFRKNYRKALDEIQYYSAYIHKPVLGNYLLAMEENLMKCALGLDIEIENIGENGIMEIGADSLFQIYMVRVTLSAGSAGLMQLFNNIETMNPLVSVTELSIAPEEKQPMKHRVSFVASWLIWKNPFLIPDYIENPPLPQFETDTIDETGISGEKDMG